MAFRAPVLTKCRTSTTGTGTYTLDESVPAAGYRLPTNAETDGDLASGDQVPYEVVDPNVTGTPKLMEVGVGTIVKSGGVWTLTRDTVYQPNGTAVSWGAGARDVLIMTGKDVLMALFGAQTVTGNKTFTNLLTTILSGSALGVDAQTALLVQNSSTASTEARAAIVAGTSGVSELSLGDTGGQYRGRIRYNHSSDSLDIYAAGTFYVRLTSAGVLQNAGGVPYENFPSGTAMVFRQASPPTGWTKSTADNDAALRVVSGTPGASGGTRGLSSANTGSHTLSISEMPAHHHGVTTASGTPTTSWFALDASALSPGTFKNSLDEGGGGSHDHPLALKYVDVLVATKN